MIKIIADSTCGIPYPALINAGIEVLPQIITFENESYRDDTEIDTASFLLKLRASTTLPKTAAPPHALYDPIYRKILDDGDSALVITPSAEVSGTYRSAITAAQEFNTDRIKIIDTRTIAGGLGSIVLQAKKWADTGMPMDELVHNIETMMSKEHVYFMVPTLEYLHKGGRIGGAAKLVGDLLKIVPILSIQNGKVEPYEKVRTNKQAYRRIVDLIVNQCKKNPTPYITISHCDNQAGAEILKQKIVAALRIQDLPVFVIPPAIVVHVGPEALSVSFFADKK